MDARAPTRCDGGPPLHGVWTTGRVGIARGSSYGTPGPPSASITCAFWKTARIGRSNILGVWFNVTLKPSADVGRSCPQIWSSPSRIGRLRTKFGKNGARVRVNFGRNWSKVGRNRATLTECGPILADLETNPAEIAQIWPMAGQSSQDSGQIRPESRPCAGAERPFAEEHVQVQEARLDGKDDRHRELPAGVDGTPEPRARELTEDPSRS